MQLGLGVILSLLILLPGFGLYFAIFTRKGGNGLEPMNPGANSVLTLAIISIGTVVGHFLLAVLLSLQASICKTECLSVGFQPDLYAHIFALNEQNVTAFSVFILLFGDMVMGVIMFGLGRKLAQWKCTKSYISRIRYGALSKLFEEAEPERKTLYARIITRMERNYWGDPDSIIGYQGVVNDMVIPPFLVGV